MIRKPLRQISADEVAVLKRAGIGVRWHAESDDPEDGWWKFNGTHLLDALVDLSQPYELTAEWVPWESGLRGEAFIHTAVIETDYMSDDTHVYHRAEAQSPDPERALAIVVAETLLFEEQRTGRKTKRLR